MQKLAEWLAIITTALAALWAYGKKNRIDGKNELKQEQQEQTYEDIKQVESIREKSKAMGADANRKWLQHYTATKRGKRMRAVPADNTND